MLLLIIVISDSNYETVIPCVGNGIKKSGPNPLDVFVNLHFDELKVMERSQQVCQTFNSKFYFVNELLCRGHYFFVKGNM